MTHESDILQAEALLDALPFIQRFRGQTVVVKYGGSAMEDEHLVGRTLRDVVLLEAVGVRPVIVHGGGKAITSRMREAGIKAQFVNGLRVTDAASIAIVERTLDGVINPMIVDKIGEFGGKAVRVPGRTVILARKVPPQPGAGGVTTDLGFVGEVAGVDLAAVNAAVAQGAIPVISPLGADRGGTVLNINADIAAGEIAAGLRAAKLVYISDVRGIMRDPTRADSLIPSVTPAVIARLIRDGIIDGGMIPKVESAVAALKNGVGKVHLIDGRVTHALLLEIFTDAGIGTQIVA